MEERREEVIHLQWEGPLAFEAVASFNGVADYGLYQVCGPHPVYGRNSLLYLGRAQKRTFAVRLREEGWEDWQIANGSVIVYLGRLSDSATPPDDMWNDQIARTERLLIRAHRPAHNATGLYRNTDPTSGYLHVLNWGDRGALLPEVSGARWSSRFAIIAGYGPYGSHSRESQGSVIAPSSTDREEPADSVRTSDIVHDDIALSVARILAAANQRASALGVDVAQSLITITQRSLEDGLIWRVSYGPKDYVNRRGGDLIIDVEPSGASIKQMLRGQ